MRPVKIVEYEPAYAPAFYRLNVEWLDKYFYVEDYDHKVLSNPEQYIISEGGHILFAIIDGKAVGTAALIYRADEGYELSKMAVAPGYQGQNIGKRLIYSAIGKTIALGANRIFLDSNTKLAPALGLYQKVGFREIPVPTDTPYERCDIRMEIRL